MTCLGRIFTGIALLVFLCLCFVLVPATMTESRQTLLSINQFTAELEEFFALFKFKPETQVVMALLALPIVFLAGFSEAVGHAVVLFANRVSPNRFAATLLLNSLLYVASYFIEVLSITLVIMVGFQRETGIVRTMVAVGMSYVPLLYSFLIAVPYFGLLIVSILNVATFLLLVNALTLLFSFTYQQALVCAVAGFALFALFRWTIGRPVEWIAGHMRDFVAGRPVRHDVTEAIAYVEQQIREGR